ncbi:fatty acid synthase subunit beta domain-containing protein, partial [Corynebacterium sp.]|uniref:fatty acid synthase subunit beta domain-containing protein n=1 Tax=Corynebacterium sp. TaxID=1720 RepID=UPI002A91A926
SAQLAGHSQGSLGVAAVKDARQALALAVLMGTAAAVTQGANDSRSHMLSVRGVPREMIEEYLAGDAAIAVVNGRVHFALSGTPEDLAKTESNIAQAAESYNEALEERLIGGSEINPVFDVLRVALPFHHASLQAAADLTVEYATQCGLDADLARELADSILVQPHNWVESVNALNSNYLISLDRGLSSLTAPLITGTGKVVIPAATAAERDNLATPGTELPTAVNYEEFSPKLISLPNGKSYTQTRFSEWTGMSPIILGGMTPTTMDPGIVAAAANGGYWSEMAGGGQYSDEAFTINKDGMMELLEPGRTAAFNTMFFDRYLWNLQFGQARIVPKARANGAAFTGVTISAGIPELDEAKELLDQLTADGFPYISFKPGTTKQIQDCIAIAADNPSHRVIIQIEDGHAGGHHSWVDLDDLLVDTYAEVREYDNAILTVGGGVYSPERAAELINGDWATRWDLPLMPVDAVFIGTVAMATKEAKATDSVKDLLVNTAGLSPEDNGGWVARGTGRNGVASSQSHLLADIHDLDNSYARASRLITSMSIEEYSERRDEIIEALSHTSKPFFGEIEEMTYAEWVERFVELAYPFIDSSWDARFLSVLHRVEGRLNAADHGEIPTLFPEGEQIDPRDALATLLNAYPEAREIKVSPRDAAWWIGLHYAYPKPMPWVPAIDGDLKVWYGKDTLWQAQDERYTADQVRIIPGPVAVAGITKKNEPVADLLARFEAAATQSLIDAGATPEDLFSRLSDATSVEEYLRAAPTLVWHGHLMENPAYAMSPEAFDIVETDGEWSIRINTDSYWDDLPEDQRPFYVRDVMIPIDLPSGVATGGSPVVSDERLPKAVYDLLAGLAGVGSTSETGDKITEMPRIIEGSQSADAPFGVAKSSFTFPASLLAAHTAVTGAALGSDVVAGTPDALVGPCWPAIYTALGSGMLPDGFPVIEGLLNAVHLDHVIDLRVPLRELADGRTIDVTSRCSAIEESVSGRIVTVELELTSGGELVATQMHRFAIRGRATTTTPPSIAPAYGGGPLSDAVEATPRSFVDRATVTAPHDMTPFALVSGDYNPIHSSYNASGLVGLQAPLVHGMWLSATAQHLAGRHGKVTGWTYSMFGMVQLDDTVEITVERVGRVGIRPAFEVTCRIDGEVVSRGQALMAQPRTAYVYPGQGVQAVGMGKGDRDACPAAREIWRRADRYTRSELGFSIQRIVDENPTSVTVRGTEFKHPGGVLHLTQFTQVALAVVAYAQTERLRVAGALGEGAMYAGHSLGEYTALASLANIFDLEAVIDIVYSRGSAMGSLVPRDADGNSEYGMGALRPNMIGVGPDEVQDYVAAIAEQTGEFLEIVNYNISGQQYSVAGTKKGLAALEKAANSVRERAYVTVPGIDVPFHSRVLRDGVPAFAEKLDELLPATIDVDILVDRYVPNLVARPFELTQDFIDAVTAEVPSERLAGVTVDNTDRNTLARTLIIELLAWQFASPVRWIETQDLLLERVDQIIEVGLASSPTLTNLAKREMDVVGRHVPVFNVEANQDRVMLADTVSAPEPEIFDEPETPAAETEAAPAAPAAAAPAPAAAEAPAPAAPAATGGSPVTDLPFAAADAIMVLFAFQNKIRLEQINDSDNIEELTGGVSSRRNQLLMDMSAELGVPAIDGAAEADVATLRERVNQAAPGYSAFGPVLGESVTARLRQLLGAAGLKPAFVEEQVTGTWGLPATWTPHVEAEILLGSRGEESVRGGSLATLPAVASKADATALVDAAVQAVAARHGQSVSQASASAGAGGGVVDSAALDAYKSEVTDTLVSTARTLLAKLGVEDERVEIEAPDTTIIDTIEAELGSGWVQQVTPVFDARQAVLFDDRWAQAREDLARVARGIADIDVARFAGTGATVAEQAQWYADNGFSGPLAEIARVALEKPELEYANDVALVTGAAPGSIATALVERLLAGGATVVMTASRVSQARKEFARTLYRD